MNLKNIAILFVSSLAVSEGKDECCDAEKAECLACKEAVTLVRYCEKFPEAVGCPEPTACCEAMTASCLACKEGVTPAEYCEKHPSTDGCKIPCDSLKGPPSEDMTGCPMDDCLPPPDHCELYNKFFHHDDKCCESNCNLRDKETKGRCKPRPGCCEALTPKCNACREGLSLDEYCEKYPKMCDPPKEECCKAMTAECHSCRKGLSIEEYCAKKPATKGCDIDKEELCKHAFKTFKACKKETKHLPADSEKAKKKLQKAAKKLCKKQYEKLECPKTK